MNQKRVSVVGGTGFLGRYVVNRLLRAGYDVQVVSRNATQQKHLFTAAASGGRILLKDANICKPKTLEGLFEGDFAVVNLVGILFETGRQRFSNIHAQCPERLAKIAKESGVSRFVHLSALGVNRATNSSYARSKLTGENAVSSVFKDATILRPSVVFGMEDNFTNQFANMSAFSPALPLIGGGETKFQPVFVDDVAKAVAAVLEEPATKGKLYELGGPDIFSFKEILQQILKVTKRERMLVSIPWAIAKVMGRVANFLPKPPLTSDQVQLLKYDNVVHQQPDGFTQLKITPQPLSVIMPRYLKRETSVDISGSHTTEVA